MARPFEDVEHILAQTGARSQAHRALAELASVTPRGEAVRLAYVNPETGMECMPILGFSAIHLWPGESLRLPTLAGIALIISGLYVTVTAPR